MHLMVQAATNTLCNILFTLDPDMEGNIVKTNNRKLFWSNFGTLCGMGDGTDAPAQSRMKEWQKLKNPYQPDYQLLKKPKGSIST